MTPLDHLKGLGRPTDWKLAVFFQFTQKGVRKDPGSDRPLSLTSGPGKIMEKFILGTTERHSKNNAIFRHSQHGFKKGKSCLNNFYPSTIRSPAQRMKRRLHPKCMLVFWHFNKAFYTVPHNILLEKLSSCAMSKYKLYWMKDRDQRVVVNVSGWLLMLFLRAQF